MDSANRHLQCIAWLLARHHASWAECGGEPPHLCIDRQVREPTNKTQAIGLAAKPACRPLILRSRRYPDGEIAPLMLPLFARGYFPRSTDDVSPTVPIGCNNVCIEIDGRLDHRVLLSTLGPQRQSLAAGKRRHSLGRSSIDCSRVQRYVPIGSLRHRFL